LVLHPAHKSFLVPYTRGPTRMSAANASQQHPGLISWANNLSHQISSAAGEEEFRDFVQVKGFDWLASYVEGVLNDE
jgi:hypothetical protein